MGKWKEVGYLIQVNPTVHILPGESGSGGALVAFHNADLAALEERAAILESRCVGAVALLRGVLDPWDTHHGVTDIPRIIDLLEGKA